MNRVHLATLDLNLLKVFEALFEEGSATRAAQRLGLTQSAVSHALNRLRYALGDDLFLRTPAGLRPTALAAAKAPEIIGALRRLAGVLVPEDFEPSATTRRFTLETGPYVGTVFLPSLVGRLRALAPRAGLSVRNSGADLAEALDSGRADVAIGSFEVAPERFGRARLFEDRLVWAIRADHPAAAAAGAGDASVLLTLSHIIIAVGDEVVEADRAASGGLARRAIWDDRDLRRILARSGATAPAALTVPDSQTALALVTASDMIAFVPRRYALAYAGRKDLRIIEAAADGAPPAEVSLIWRRDRDDAPIAWLRDLILTCGEALHSATP